MRTSLAAGTAVLALLALGALPATAQDIKWESESRLELGGSLGRVLQLMPGVGDKIQQATYIKGDFLRTDSGNESSTIMNAGDGSILSLDHDDKTYWIMDLAQMRAAMQGAAGQVAAADEEMPEAQEEAGQPDSVHFEVHASVDRTGKRERIAGFQAEQAFITIEIVAESYDQEADSTVRGTLVVLDEVWLSTEFPGHQAEQDFYRRWAERFQQDANLEQEARGMSQVFAQDPRIQEGMEQMAEQLQGLEGTPVRTIAHFVTVPDGVTFDREAVLRDANKSLAGDIGGAAVSGAAGSVRSRIGGLLGRRNEPEARPDQPRQAVVMRFRDEIKKVESGSLAESLFHAPAGYTEQNPFQR